MNLRLSKHIVSEAVRILIVHSTVLNLLLLSVVNTHEQSLLYTHTHTHVGLAPVTQPFCTLL